MLRQLFPAERTPAPLDKGGLTWSYDCNSTAISFPWSGTRRCAWYYPHVDICFMLLPLVYTDSASVIEKFSVYCELEIIFIICVDYVDNSLKRHDRTHSSLYVCNKTYNSEVKFPPKKGGFLFQCNNNLYMRKTGNFLWMRMNEIPFK